MSILKQRSILVISIALCVGTIVGATKRTAKVKVINHSSQTIRSVSVVHKYSDNYKDRHIFDELEDGAEAEGGTVSYNTGIFTTGKDWWVVTWYDGTYERRYYSDPNNFRNVIDLLEKVAPAALKVAASLAAKYAAVKSGNPQHAKLFSKAAKKVAGLAADLLFNSESTDGFKQHILRSDDEGEFVSIYIYNNGAISIKSPSGTSDTVYKSEKVWEQYKTSGNTVTRSRWFSEEGEGYSGRQTAPVAGIECSGDYCDNKRLVIVRDGNSAPVLEGPYWTPWISDESPSQANCPTDMIVNEIQCSDHYCDRLRMQCGPLADNYRVKSDDRKETGWFSEEDGERRCTDGYYLWGLTCSGDYCDNLKLNCVLVEKMIVH